MPAPTDWLHIAQRLQAIAQTGITFASNDFETERHQEIHALSMQILANLSDVPVAKLTSFFAAEAGYPTPKVDIRAVLFRGTDEILLVQEKLDSNRWSLPGGWADVGYTPFEVAVKEVQEETGLVSQAVRLLALLDKKQHNHPPQPWYIYKVFVLCRVTGGTIQSHTTETAEVRWVHRSELPSLDLSVDRVTLSQLETMLEFARNPDLPTLCD
jgi:ADP-ribose pyrophosphatase YjhB (NUDIX family)